MLDLDTLLGMFGQDVAVSDQLRTSKGDVSEMTNTLSGPGGPFDDMIPAVITDPETGEVIEPAALSPGEYVLDVPTVLDLGEGDEAMGSNLLKLLQENPDARSAVRETLKKFI